MYEWLTAAGISSGRLFRAINKGGRLHGDGLGANVVWSVVQGYAAAIGLPNLAPTICGGLARNSAGPAAGTWSRSSCYSATLRYLRPTAISGHGWT
jgi:hypothetical protein